MVQKKSRILVVEDEPIVAKDIQQTLMESGYEVVKIVSTGEDAIREVQNRNPDLVLMDIVLGGEMDGVEAAGQIHSRYNIPVVYLTAYADKETLRRAKITGSYGYIVKPYQKRDLEITLETTLYRAEMENRLRKKEEEIRKLNTASISNLQKEITERKKAEGREKELAVASAIAAAEKKRAGELESAYEKLKSAQAQLVQAEKLSGIGRLAAGVAHELNTPLAGLLGLLRTYKKTVKESTREHKELILMLDATEHMAGIVRGLTAFARQPKGEFAELSLNDVIESTLSFSSRQLTAGGIKISKYYADDLQKIQGDKGQLQQVVLNMITNARDAMAEGGEFAIKTRNSEDGNMVIAEFTDTGSGIKEEDLPSIFEPFFTTKQIGKGIGLGLSVAHGIMKGHNGEIFVENRPEKGAKFTIAFLVQGGEDKRRSIKDEKGYDTGYRR